MIKILNRTKTLDSYQLNILDRTESNKKIWVRRTAIGAVTLLALALITVGALTLYANLSHTPIGLISPNTLSSPAATSLITTGGMLLVTTIIIARVKAHHRNQEIDQLLEQNTVQLSRLLAGMYEEQHFLDHPSANNLISLTLESKGEPIYVVLTKGAKGRPGDMYALKDLERRNRLLRQLDA